jgi:hypothetical protein
MNITIQFTVSDADFVGLMQPYRITPFETFFWSDVGLVDVDEGYEVQAEGEVHTITRAKFEAAIAKIFEGEIDDKGCSAGLAKYVLTGSCVDVNDWDVDLVCQVACFGEERYA